MSISDFLTDFKLHPSDVRFRDTHVISAHIGWLNWGNVGHSSFYELVNHLEAKKLGEFERPGDFYDFVSYRGYSSTYLDSEGNRHTEFPNSMVYYTKREKPLSDLVFLYLLEPTHFGEIYVDRVVDLMKKLNVSRYNVIGAMGSAVPHTRPIIVSGRSSDPESMKRLSRMDVRERAGSQYQGPTSIFNMISPRLQSEGIATVSLIANLPHYANHFNLQGPDHNGIYSVLNPLSKLEEFEIPLDRIKVFGEQQYEGITKFVNRVPQLSAMVKELEDNFDQEKINAEEETGSPVPPEIQKAIDEALRNRSEPGKG